MRVMKARARAIGSKRSRTVGVLLMAVLASAALAACGSSSKSGKTANGLIQLSIARTDPNGMQTSVFNVAQQEGFFTKEGLKVSVPVLNGDAAAIPAVQSGAVDFTENTAPSVAAADHNGSHLSVIATFSYPPGEIILSKAAAAKAHITASSSMADKVRALKGQTLAVEDVGGGLQYQIDDLLQKYGVPTNSVNVVGISSFTSQLTSLQRGVIDGASIIPPFGNTAILQQGAVPVGNIWGGDVPQLSKTPYEVIDGSTSYIKAHPAIAEKVQKAFALALAWMHKQTAQVAKINEQALGGSFSAAAVKAGVGTGAGWPTSPKLAKAGYDNVIAFMKVSGLAADTDVSYRTLVAPIARG